MLSKEQEWRLHGCHLKALLEGWRVRLSKQLRKILLLQKGSLSSCQRQCQKVGHPPLAETPNFEFDLTRVCVGKDLNTISSTMKYTLHSFLKYL